jgi:hypothetical protein
VSVPALVVFAALGAGTYFGGWYGGLEGHPAWVAAHETPLSPNATAAEKEAHDAALQQARREARNSALGAVTVLLLGLIGSVIGGWMACGEPMTFTHYKTRRTTSGTALPAGTT